MKKAPKGGKPKGAVVLKERFDFNQTGVADLVSSLRIATPCMSEGAYRPRLTARWQRLRTDLR